MLRITTSYKGFPEEAIWSLVLRAPAGTYYKNANVIWLDPDMKQIFLPLILFHELGHWFITKLDGRKDCITSADRFWDSVWYKYIMKWVSYRMFYKKNILDYEYLSRI